MSRKTGFTLNEVKKWEAALSEFRNNQLIYLGVELTNKYHQGNTAQRLAKRTLKVLDELRWELENMRGRLNEPEKGPSDEWVSLGCRGAGTDEVYYKHRHTPCGTDIEFMQGYEPICPKCQPEEWAKTYGKRK